MKAQSCLFETAARVMLASVAGLAIFARNLQFSGEGDNYGLFPIDIIDILSIVSAALSVVALGPLRPCCARRLSSFVGRPDRFRDRRMSAFMLFSP